MELIGTTWKHQFQTNQQDYPVLIVREWQHSPAGGSMIEIARADTGEWLRRDYPALVQKFLERNWYEQVTA